MSYEHTKKPNLKACPFCGGGAVYDADFQGNDHPVFFSVRCAEKGCAESPQLENGRQAASWWNDRHPAGKGEPAKINDLNTGTLDAEDEDEDLI